MARIALGILVSTAAAAKACAQAPTPPDGLVWGGDPHPDVSALPRLTGAGADRINPVLDRLDGRAEADREECRTEPETGQMQPDADWTRAVWAPFTGPRFLTITVNTSYYCGGAYPSVDFTYLTFDRRTAAAADWTALWPSANVRPLDPDAEVTPAITQAPAVVDWFENAVRTDPENTPDWLNRCDLDVEEGTDQPVVIWLDAERGGIGMDWAFLPHAIRACGSPQVMPVDHAARLGLSPDVVVAIRQGQADRVHQAVPSYTSEPTGP